jgi:hypothetical protein
MVAPWPGLTEAYGRILRAEAHLVFGHFGPKGIVLFLATGDSDDPLHDSKILLGNRDLVKPNGMRPMKVVKMSTRYIGYIPVVLVVALLLATPLPWRRRLWALFWGMVLVHCFVAFVIFIIILHKYQESEALGLFQSEGCSKWLVNAAHEVFVAHIGPLFLAPVVIWIAVGFRRGDWSTMLGKR